MIDEQAGRAVALAGRLIDNHCGAWPDARAAAWQARLVTLARRALSPAMWGGRNFKRRRDAAARRPAHLFVSTPLRRPTGPAARLCTPVWARHGRGATQKVNE